MEDIFTKDYKIIFLNFFELKFYTIFRKRQYDLNSHFTNESTLIIKKIIYIRIFTPKQDFQIHTDEEIDPKKSIMVSCLSSI